MFLRAPPAQEKSETCERRTQEQEKLRDPGVNLAKKSLKMPQNSLPGGKS